MIFPGGAASSEKTSTPRTIQRKILGQATADLPDVCSRLVEGKREPVEHLRDGHCLLPHFSRGCAQQSLSIYHPGSAQEQERPSFGKHLLDCDTLRQTSQHTRARREQDMPTIRCRKHVADSTEFLNVVYNQQPVSMQAQPALNGLKHAILIAFVALR